MVRKVKRKKKESKGRETKKENDGKGGKEEQVSGT